MAMRDGLNATNRPIWFSITGRLAYNDSEWHKEMHCIHPPRPSNYPNEYGAFTVRPWVRAGKDVLGLANSYLIEYCNNYAFWGFTNAVSEAGGKPMPGGFLSQLDSQQLLTYDNMTRPGAYNDNDMLENCNPDPHGGMMTSAEFRSQLTTFAVQSSPLILGHDIRNQSRVCLDVITNKEVLALADSTRGRLVYQYPMAIWPDADRVPPIGSITTDSGVADASVNISLQVWAKALDQRSTPGVIGVVVLNRGATPTSLNLTWDMVGLAPSTKVAVRDLWAHADEPAAVGSLWISNIASHDVKALTLTPA